MEAGQSILVSGYGFRPFSPVRFTFYSDPISAGRSETDGTGSFATQVLVPSALTPGAHRFEVVGIDIDRVEVSVSIPVNVAGLALAMTEPIPRQTSELALTGFSSEPLVLTALILLACGRRLTRRTPRSRGNS